MCGVLIVHAVQQIRARPFLRPAYPVGPAWVACRAVSRLWKGGLRAQSESRVVVERMARRPASGSVEFHEPGEGLPSAIRFIGRCGIGGGAMLLAVRPLGV